MTVIATGFEKTGMPTNIMQMAGRRSRLDTPVNNEMQDERESEFVPRTLNTENLDIPTFLRNRGRTR